MPTPYSKQTWVDNTTPVDASHMSHMEDGIANADASLTYLGDYAAGTYNNGDVVVAADGFSYVCVKDGTTTAPVAFPGSNGGVPLPVVNGQWIKGVGGAAVWSAIAPSDLVGYPTDATKALYGDGSWRVPSGTELAFYTTSTNFGPTGVSSTGNGDPLFAFPAATFEAVKYYFELSAIFQDSGGLAGYEIRLHDGTAPGPLIQATTVITPGTNPGYGPVFFRFAFTPTAGSHTYQVRWRDAAGGHTFTVPNSVYPITGRIYKA